MSYTLLSPSFLYTVSNSATTPLSDEIHLLYDSVFVNLFDQYKNYNSTSFPSAPTSLLPLAVRYISPDKSVYLIERPPFQSPIDFSTAKSYQKRRSPVVLKDKTMWIPWTVTMIRLIDTYPFYEFHLYFNDGPLISTKDQLVPSFLPNCGNGHVCLGTDSASIISAHQNNTEVSITEIYNLFFNSYFVGWNNDIHNVLRNLSFIKDRTKAFERITHANKSKELKIIDSSDRISYDYTSFLLLLSYLNLEEMLQYIGSLKELYSSTNSSYHSLNHISLFSTVYHDHGVTGSTLAHCDVRNFQIYFNDYNYQKIRVVISGCKDNNLENNTLLGDVANNPYLISQIFSAHLASYQDPSNHSHVVLNFDFNQIFSKSESSSEHEVSS